MVSENIKRSNKKRLKQTLIVAAIIIFCSMTFVIIFNVYRANNNNNDLLTSFTYIYIERDAQFKSTYGFPGDGTTENPYIIENYLFEDQVETAITIKDTTKVFIIRNCTLKNNFVGISLRNIDPNTATIINSTLMYNEQGIRVIQCNIVNITSNIFLSNGEGVGLDLSQETTFSKNYFDGIYQVAFVAQDCNIGFFFENTLVGGGNVYFYDCDEWSIHHNLNIRTSILLGSDCRYYDNILTVNGGLSSNSNGFHVYNNNFSGGTNLISIASSNEVFIYNNTIKKGGFSFSTDISISNFATYFFQNNTVNNKPAIFLINENGMTINNDTFSQIFSVNCINLEINSGYYRNTREAISCFYSTNVTIANNDLAPILITGYSSNFGIQLYQCDEVLVTNNTVTAFSYGINVIDSTDVFIEKNFCEDNYHGIFVTDSDDIIISENNCDQNDFGISVRFAYGVNGLLVENNNCSYNSHQGIHIQYCALANVSNNMVNHNEVGISLNNVGGMIKDNIAQMNSITGINCRSDNLVIRNNIVQYNEIIGIMITNSENIRIFLNQFIENVGFGIEIYSSNIIAVYANNFIDNQLSNPMSSQALDESGTINNVFYSISGSAGNYWSDWTSGTYFIDGSTGSFDLYPRSVPVIF